MKLVQVVRNRPRPTESCPEVVLKVVLKVLLKVVLKVVQKVFLKVFLKIDGRHCNRER